MQDILNQLKVYADQDRPLDDVTGGARFHLYPRARHFYDDENHALLDVLHQIGFRLCPHVNFIGRVEGALERIKAIVGDDPVSCGLSPFGNWTPMAGSGKQTVHPDDERLCEQAAHFQTKLEAVRDAGLNIDTIILDHAPTETFKVDTPQGRNIVRHAHHAIHLKCITVFPKARLLAYGFPDNGTYSGQEPLLSTVSQTLYDLHDREYTRAGVKNAIRRRRAFNDIPGNAVSDDRGDLCAFLALGSHYVRDASGALTKTFSNDDTYDPMLSWWWGREIAERSKARNPRDTFAPWSAITDYILYKPDLWRTAPDGSKEVDANGWLHLLRFVQGVHGHVPE